MKILVVGSVALDTIISPAGEVNDVLGGSATYFALAASYLGEVGIVAVIGNDFPDEYLQFLKSRSINLEGIEVKKGKTFRWTGKYGEDPNLRETLSLCQNVFKNFHPELPESYLCCDYIFLANIDPELQADILSRVKVKKMTAADTMDIWIRTRKEALLDTLRKTDLMMLNDSEARQLSGERNLIKAAGKILSFGAKKVIIKKGESGALLVDENGIFSIPAFPVETVVDPTGAGDSFAGGVLGFLAKEGALSEKKLRKAILYGTVLASFCVEDFSVNRFKSITQKDIQRRLNQFKGMVSL